MRSQLQAFLVPKNRRAYADLTEKRPNGLTLIPWQSGKSLVWDVTVVCPLAHSYVASAARQPGSVAELATSKKMDKYTSLAADYHFQRIAVEMLGPIKNESASHYGRPME